MNAAYFEIQIYQPLIVINKLKFSICHHKLMEIFNQANINFWGLSKYKGVWLIKANILKIDNHLLINWLTLKIIRKNHSSRFWNRMLFLKFSHSPSNLPPSNWMDFRFRVYRRGISFFLLAIGYLTNILFLKIFSAAPWAVSLLFSMWILYYLFPVIDSSFISEPSFLCLLSISLQLAWDFLFESSFTVNKGSFSTFYFFALSFSSLSAYFSFLLSTI